MQDRITSSKKQTSRRAAILDTLDKSGFVRVNELSESLHISAVTIRKDLEKLEMEGLLIRTHGGAKKVEAVQYENRRQEKQEEKMRIAAAAADLVQDGDFVFINVGTTCFYVCEALKEKKNLTVVTNSIHILNTLLSTPSITTFFLGGKVHPGMQITTGDDVTEQLSKYVADKLFLGMDGVDLAMGATTYNHAEDSIMRQMMQQAKEKILVVDDSKIGRVTFAKIADLTDFDTIITNYTEQNAEALEKMRSQGIHVLCV